MKTSSRALLGLAALLALALVAYFVISKPQPPDQEQIAAQIESARVAATHRDINGIMKVVSATYQDPVATNTDQLNFILRRTLGRGGAFKISTSPPDVAVTGDTATSKMHVIIVSNESNNTVYDRNVTMHWKREEGHRFVVIPTTVWRITSADYGSFGEE